jgi:8-oxo-dGTP pyrophosphatase MutT (NUDIX family)
VGADLSGGAGSDAASALAGLVAESPEESADLAELRAVAAGPAPWDRGTALHLTGSAFVIHPPTGRVLLRWHERQQAWIQVGGHADPGETDPFVVALREAIEETGLADLRPWPPGEAPALLHAVVVSVPAGKGEPAHRHGDLRYVLATDRPDDAVAETADAPLRWLTLEEAFSLTEEANVEESLRRIMALR